MASKWLISIHALDRRSSWFQECFTRKFSTLVQSLEDGITTWNSPHTHISPDLYAQLLKPCDNLKCLPYGMSIHDHIVRHKLEEDFSVGDNLIHMYSRCGDVETAHKLLVSRKDRQSVFVWNVTMRAFAQQRQYDMVQELFSQMVCEGALPDTFTMVNVISACTNKHSLIDGKRAHVQTLGRELASDHIIGNSLLNMYSKCKSIDDVKSIFSEMPKRNIVAWTAVMDAFLQQGCIEDVFQLSIRMQEEGEIPDSISFLTLLSSCCRPEALFKGNQVHISVLQNGCALDIYIVSALVNMYGKCGSLENAYKVFIGISDHNVVSWNSIIAVYVENGSVDSAIQLFNRMVLEGVFPDRVTFIATFSGCANKAILAEGLRMHTYALHTVHKLDVILGTNILNTYGKCGSLIDMCKAFDCLCERNLVSWNVVLGALIEHGEIDQGLQMFCKLHEECILPDKFTFISLLEACSDQSVLDEGEILHSYIIELSLELDVIVGTSLVKMYGRCSGMEAAHRMFLKMDTHNVVTWNTMISLHAQRGMHRDVLRCFRQMHSEGIFPDNATFPTILDSCASETTIYEASLMHSYVIECGLEVDTAISNTLINMYSKTGNLEDSSKVFKSLHKPDLLSSTAMMTAYVQQGNCHLALKLFGEVNPDGLLPFKATTLIILEACADLCELVTGEKIYTNIVYKGLDLDAAVSTALVNMYGKSGNLKPAQKIFDLVLKKDVILWTAMITVYAQHGFGKEAECLFVEMQITGLVPNNVTFINILAACSHTGLVSEGCYFLTSMICHYGMRPLLEHWDCMIDLFGRAGLLDEAEEIIYRMPFPPRIVSLMSLLGSCRHQSDWDRSERIGMFIFDLNLEQSAAYVMLSNIAHCREEIESVMYPIQDEILDMAG